MTKNIKLLIVAGARPNFMKVAPIIRAIPAFNQRVRDCGVTMEYRLVHTGQHYDPLMSGAGMPVAGQITVKSAAVRAGCEARLAKAIAAPLPLPLAS